MSFLKAWEVVRTYVLSRRWCHLWASVPCLDVRVGRDDYGETPEDFPEFVRLLFSCLEGRRHRWTRSVCGRAMLMTPMMKATPRHGLVVRLSVGLELFILLDIAGTVLFIVLGMTAASRCWSTQRLSLATSRY
uniref:Uncharacterized protein n=1 Tax=Arundo donax TaxID=35708 RepID=A0A0A8ZL23_ARUDO